MFLLNELASVNRTLTPWLIVLIHSPWYNSNTYHYLEGETVRVEFEAFLNEYQVDVVFSGHVHAYERTVSLAISPLIFIVFWRVLYWIASLMLFFTQMEESIARKTRKQPPQGDSQPWRSRPKQLPLHITNSGWLVATLGFSAISSSQIAWWGQQLLLNSLNTFLTRVVPDETLCVLLPF